MHVTEDLSRARPCAPTPGGLSHLHLKQGHLQELQASYSHPALLEGAGPRPLASCQAGITLSELSKQGPLFHSIHQEKSGWRWALFNPSSSPPLKTELLPWLGGESVPRL